MAANVSRPLVHLGADIGSTTTKLVALDARTHATLYARYVRHNAHQAESLVPLLEEVAAKLPNSRFSLVMSGSGGKAIADCLGVPYIQEVVANSIAIQQLHPNARCAIELGGQDAKMIFFAEDPRTGRLTVSDMRMNGSCAGGTGAFIDEIAALLKTPVQQLDGLAAAGSTVYQISGRCGVYAKTDIQPLLNQGARKEDIVLSTFHAIAKQTLGGLAQGLDICAPVLFEGGPLTFNPQLVRVFAQRLGLAEDEIVVPDSPETIVAQGAAWSVDGMFAGTDCSVRLDEMANALATAREELRESGARSEPFFADADELAAFRARHALPVARPIELTPGQVVRAYLGVDSGSTTTKFALIGEDGALLDSFYANNEGEPLDVAKNALVALGRRYEDAGAQLEVLGVGTTGYGELLFHRALHADVHVVETVAHAVAATAYVPDASFILDIGGQDMKAIWLRDGVVCDILVNEACSSGCGSFLENFAKSLGVPTREIADAAFRATSPAVLGSRCTVFMNSSVVTEQRCGKSPDDIMAGLCRSIIENVFTKVIRVSNLSSLGERIVVQGGTFNNDAVLAAFENYVGHPVARAPYPGLMGAIGAALLAKQHAQEAAGGEYASTFIGLDGVAALAYEQESDATCPFCTNACNRTLVRFGDGGVFVTGNRCERGLVVGDPRDESVREQVRAARNAHKEVPDLYALRQELLFADYQVRPVCADRGLCLGLPRALSLWDNAPFWTTLLRALGFTVKLSRLSTRALYEAGLSAVPSDTVCFPAKLVHGHIRDLAAAGVDRIFMPVVTAVPSENTMETSESMCAVVKGYPMVLRNSDNPQERFGVPLDDPLFHWHTTADRQNQLARYLGEAYGISEDDVREALAQADAAMEAFRKQLADAGRQAIEDARRAGSFAVVLAGRPYHNDPLVNHDLPRMFTRLGIPVLPPDAVPGVNGDVGLERSRLDIVNNFHARMLSSAVIAAADPALEYAQVVSFGCGHDAYLTDEIMRLMRVAGGKAPLVLKVDESDISGPLNIRVRSFVETVNMRRAAEGRAGLEPTRAELPDPYPQKFTRAMRREKVLLVPNTSHAFSRLMAAAFARQGVRTVALPIGRDEAIRLGKKYVHNDICFPAQIVVGEALAALESGAYDDCEVAIATGKYIGDCRLTHYAALLRKALDDAGYEHVPIVTNDDVDSHDIHPGFKMSAATAACIAMVLPMIDALEELLRKMRPYESEAGAANAAFDEAIDAVMNGLERHGANGAIRGFRRAVDRMASVLYDRSAPRPTVLIVGEYLLNFHPGANHDIEAYLEANGFEVIEARMTDVIRKTYFYQRAQMREFGVRKPLPEAAWLTAADALFEHAHDVCDRIAAAHPLYERAARMGEIVQDSDPIIHHTFDAGEGVLIPAEIIHHAHRGCRAFLVLQPFGCLPNHIVGRGIAKRLKGMFPDAQILPLDYDPDVSFANLENRLQMLIMNARQAAAEEGAGNAALSTGAVTSEAAALTATAYDMAEISARVAACAAEVAQVAHEASVLAEDAVLRSQWDEQRQLGWFEAHADEALAQMRRVADRAAELQALAEEVRRSVRANLQQAGASFERLDALAQQAADLARQTSDDAAAYVAAAKARLDELMSARQDASQAAAERISRMRADALAAVNRISARTNELAMRADDLSREADEL